jgi:hypothetical protein
MSDCCGQDARRSALEPERRPAPALTLAKRAGLTDLLDAQPPVQPGDRAGFEGDCAIGVDAGLRHYISACLDLTGKYPRRDLKRSAGACNRKYSKSVESHLEALDKLLQRNAKPAEIALHAYGQWGVTH